MGACVVVRPDFFLCEQVGHALATEDPGAVQNVQVRLKMQKTAGVSLYV